MQAVLRCPVVGVVRWGMPVLQDDGALVDR